jgi:hypothetical protein
MQIYINKIAILTMCVLVVFSNVFAQNPPNKPMATPKLQNVTDYYLAIPSQGLLEDQCNFFLENQTRKNIETLDFRKSLIKIEDTQNAYLRLEPPSTKGDEGGEISLFKKNDGSYLLGIADWECGLVCKCIGFLEFKNDKWLNVTKRYERKILKQRRQRENKKPTSICENGYSFGREEKSLSIRCIKDSNSDRFNMKFLWNGKDFILQKNS